MTCINSEDKKTTKFFEEIKDYMVYIKITLFLSPFYFWLFINIYEYFDFLAHDNNMRIVARQHEVLTNAYYLENELKRFEDRTDKNAFDLLKLTTKNLTDTENYFGILDIVYSKIEPHYILRSDFYLRYEYDHGVDLRYEYDHGVEGTVPAIDRIKVDNEEYLTYIVYDLNKEQCEEINDINKKFNDINPVRFEELGKNTNFVCIKNEIKDDSYIFYYILREKLRLFN